MDYRPDFRETGHLIRRHPMLRAAILRATRETAEMAETIAPIDTGAYVESIEYGTADLPDRMGGYVMADDAAAAPIEFGNRRTQGRGYNILTRAAEIVGLDVDAG